MVWFDYRCPKCGAMWEERRKRDDHLLDYAEQPCPNRCEWVGDRLRWTMPPAVQKTYRY